MGGSLFIGLDIAKEPSSSGVNNDLKNYWAVDHRTDDIVDSLTDLDDPDVLTINSDFKPVFVQVNGAIAVSLVCATIHTELGYRILRSGQPNIGASALDLRGVIRHRGGGSHQPLC